MSRFDRRARRVKRLLDGVVTAGKTLSPVSTNPVPGEWAHVTKVDPEMDKQLPLLYPLYLQHTDAVSVGGSSGVTGENTEATFELLEWASIPGVHEPSEARHVTEETRDRAEFLAVPEVLNGDATALVGTLGEGIAYLEDELVPEMLADKLSLPSFLVEPLAEFVTALIMERAVFEAYIIQNPESAAAQRANVEQEDLLSPTEARQHALAADRHLDSEILYLEYSGTYGGDEARHILDAIGDDLSYARVWYGGGLSSRDQVTEIIDAGADTVVVGDIFHDIAAEEANLCARAVDDLDGTATSDEISVWLDGATDIADTSAASYLETIPAVNDPAALATEYLATTIQTYLVLRALLEAESETPDSWSDIQDLASDAGDSLSAESALRESLAADRADRTGAYVANLVGLLADEPGETPLPVDHLAGPE